jgi:hypothetical protein
MMELKVGSPTQEGNGSLYGTQTIHRRWRWQETGQIIFTRHLGAGPRRLTNGHQLVGKPTS